MDRHNDDLGNEMFHPPHLSSHVELLNSDGEHYKDKSSAPYSKIRGFLRQFRLGFITTVSGGYLNWRSNTEFRKVAIYHSRTVAVTYGLLHLVPLGGAFTLLMLQWTSYLASFTNDDTTTLQFVAKLHEIFMQASIVEITFCLVRTQVINEFVPLGLLSGALQATQLSYIWSLDYISIFKSPAIRGWRKWLFALAIPALILLISFVGPSSAILMIPRPNSPHNRKAVTKYARNSTETMYPTTIGASNGFSLEPLSLNKTIKTKVDEQYESNEYRYSGPQYTSYMTHDLTKPYLTMVNRVLRFSSRMMLFNPNKEITYILEGEQVNTTIPTRYSSDSFMSLANLTGTGSSQMLSQNGTATVKMAYPTVMTQCWQQPSPLNPEAKVYYEPDAATLTNFSTLGALAERISNISEVVQDYGKEFYAPLWTPSPQPGSTSLFVFFLSRDLLHMNISDSLSPYVNTSYSLSSLLGDTNQTFDEDYMIRVISCKLSAFWDLGDVQLQESSTDAIVKTLSYAKSLTHDAQPLRMNISHVDTIQGARFHRQIIESIPDFAGDGITTDVQTITYALGAIFALGISKIPPVYQPASGYASATDGNSFEKGHMVWYPPPGVDVANTTTFRFTLTDYGYGYGNRSTSIYLAMVVMTTYCIITILYLIYTIVTGSASTAWNSGIELVTLALQSRKPEHLGHASVGIDSVKTFSESVGIRVNTDNELELVFLHDRDFRKRGLRKIELNKEY